MAATARFAPYAPGAFFGDDLSNLLAFRGGLFASSLPQALGSAFLEKYRPVFALAAGSLFGSFGDRISLYIAANIALHALNATLVFAVLRRIGGKSIFVAAGLAVAVAASRFALYQTTQVTGLVEGLSLTFFLSALYFWIRAMRASSGHAGLLAMAAASASLALLTHERYAALVIWLPLAVLLAPHGARVGWRLRAGVAAACIAALAFDMVYKVFVADVALLMGTGGQRIDVNLGRIADFLGDGVSSLLGVNSGPDYLIGVRFEALPSHGKWVFLAMFLAPMIVSVGLSLRWAWLRRSGLSSGWRAHYEWLSLGVLMAAMLAPGVITIRLEQRWLLAPFIILVVIFAERAAFAAALWRPGVRAAFGLSVAIGSLGLDTLYANGFSQVFFVTAGRFATHVKTDVVEAGRGAGEHLVFVTSPDNCNWALLGGRFFEIYGRGRKVVMCPQSLSELATSHFSFDEAFVVKPDTGRIEDMTESMRKQASRLSRPAEYDFAKMFASGVVDNSSPVDTPTGRGALAITWNSDVGPRSTITVVSGYADRFDTLSIESGESLNLDVGMVFPAPYPARAVIQVDDGVASDRQVVALDLTPPRPGELLKFSPVEISLDRFAGKQVSVTFATQTPGPDATAHWIAFADPRISRAGSVSP